MTHTALRALTVLLLLTPGSLAFARFTVAPYVSISSTKKIKPQAEGKEKETLKQRTTYGIRGSIGFWRLLNFQLSVGQNELVTTEKTSEAVDEFDEIDYEQDLNMSTDDPESEVKITEIQRKARAMLVINPSFSIFILRAKAGVQATQRIVELEQLGQPKERTEPPITYKPVAGAGAGIRFSPRTFAIAEYSFFFYKFPETEPFEREVSVSFGVSI